MRPYRAGESFYNIIKRAVPDFVESEYPTFVEFIEAYLRFLEAQRTFTTETVRPDYGTAGNNVVQTTDEVGGPAYETRKLQEYRDVSTTLDEFRSHFVNMYAKSWPQRQNIPLDLFVHSLREFYKGKGTVEAIRWFFRAIFGQEADVHFPREDVLKASDATWSAPITIKVGVPYYANTAPRSNEDISTYFLGQRIVSATGAAQVEKVKTSIYGRAYNQYIVVNELTLKYDTIVGTFEPNQTVYNIDTDEVVYATVLPVVSGVEVNSGGSNYEIGDLVEFSEGPGQGEGYGARARVSRVSASSINGVDVLTGGDGFLVGTPIAFVSSSGSGAEAVIATIIQGDIDLEDGTDTGYLLAENNDSLILEDKDTIDLLLTIEPFVNSSALVQIDTADYGANTGVALLNGVNEYYALSVSLQAADQAPFMAPWVFTGPATVELANLAVTMDAVTSSWFTNGAIAFAITNERDVTTNSTNANTYATVIVAEHVASIYEDKLYLKNVANAAQFVAGTRLKSNAAGATMAGTLTSNGTANVVGNGTYFTTYVRPGTHIVLSSGTQFGVQTVVNNEFLIAYSSVTAAAANTWSIIPTAVISTVEQQSQRYYGKIRAIDVTSPGSGYARPPAASVDAVSARAQAVDYWDGAAIVAANGQIDIFQAANLDVSQDAGQVTRVEMIASGVNYLDANAVNITFIHGGGRTGDPASGTPILGALTQYPGQFTTTRGFLSSDKVLQDYETYNDFTYQIRVGEPFERYAAVLRKLVHPAGFKMLGQFVDTLEADADEGDLQTFENLDPEVVIDQYT